MNILPLFSNSAVMSEASRIISSHVQSAPDTEANSQGDDMPDFTQMVLYVKGQVSWTFLVCILFVYEMDICH